MNINDLIRQRRAVYPEVFSQEPIAWEELLQLLENANYAPTHRHTEPWRFRIIETKEKKEELGSILAACYQEQSHTEAFSEIKFNKMKTRAGKSAVVLAICMQRDPKASIPEWEELAAVAMAVQNIWLSAWPLGIGMYWGSPKAIESPEIATFLGLQEGECCLGFLYMGRMQPQLQLEAKRRPITDKIIRL